MTNQYPLVSVLMTSYNREMFIAKAIESVLASIYSNFELIILDDFSNDNTLIIAETYEKADQRIKVFQNLSNIGQFPNRNLAATYANGKYLMYVDSDDTITEDAIQYIIDNFIMYPLAEFATLYYNKNINKSQILSSSESIKQHFFSNNFLIIGPGGTFITSSLFKKIGGFPTIYGPAGDLFYNIKAAANGTVLLLPYIYLNYRRHDGQEINNAYSYLYNNYRTICDSLQLPELVLLKREKQLILNKHRWQFIMQALVYFKHTGKLFKIINAYKLSKIGFWGILSGVFGKHSKLDIQN